MLFRRECNCESNEKKDITDLKSLRKILGKYEHERDSLIPVLQEAQNLHGYLSKEVLEEISVTTGIPLSQIYGVATFYAQFYLEPRGKNVIKVCCGTACHVRGGKLILRTAESELGIVEGETTSDMQITLETVGCLGTCFLAPVMVVNDSYYGKLNTKRAQNILKQIKAN